MNSGWAGSLGFMMGYRQSFTIIWMKAVMTEIMKSEKVTIHPSFLFLLYAYRKKGVIKKSWKSTAKYHPYISICIPIQSNSQLRLDHDPRSCQGRRRSKAHDSYCMNLWH